MSCEATQKQNRKSIKNLPFEVLVQLLSSFVIDAEDPLPAAILKEDLEFVEQIVREKGPQTLSAPIIVGYFPLHCAAACDNYKMAKLLIQLKADVNAVSKPLQG